MGVHYSHVSHRFIIIAKGDELKDSKDKLTEENMGLISIPRDLFIARSRWAC